MNLLRTDGIQNLTETEKPEEEKWNPGVKGGKRRPKHKETKYPILVVKYPILVVTVTEDANLLFFPGSVELLSFLLMSEKPEKNQLTKRKGLCWLLVSEDSICCCLGCCSRTCGDEGKCGGVTLFLWWLGVEGVSRRKPEIKYPLQKKLLPPVCPIYGMCICVYAVYMWVVPASVASVLHYFIRSSVKVHQVGSVSCE